MADWEIIEPNGLGLRNPMSRITAGCVVGLKDMLQGAGYPALVELQERKNKQITVWESFLTHCGQEASARHGKHRLRSYAEPPQKTTITDDITDPGPGTCHKSKKKCYEKHI